MKRYRNKIGALLLAGILAAASAVPASASSADGPADSAADFEQTGTDDPDTQADPERADGTESIEGMDGGRTSAGRDASEENGVDPEYKESDLDSESTADDTVQDAEKEPVRADISSVDTPDVKAEITDAPPEGDKVVIEEDDKPYLALGANLTAEQKNAVLGFMGINPQDLGSYRVATVTNEEEHQYLDGYLDAATIGTRALSSVVIVKRDKGDGIRISTKNISYCTIGMYKNALATAGLADADVIVAAPFPISGTAALIGAMKAYADMEDTKVDKETLDAAMNEIVVTGELNESLGDDVQTEEFMAYVKQQVLENGLQDSYGIQDVIADASKKFGIALDDNETAKVSALMEKIGSLDIDVDKILEQAGSIYDSIREMEQSSGILSKIAAFFKDLFDAIVNFVKGLFD